MLLNKKDGAGKGKKGRVVIGYDMNDDHALISYCASKEGEVETLPIVAGTAQYNIPMLLWKKKGVNHWLFGKEATKAEEEEGTGVECLLTLARRGEPIVIEEENFDPVALLALFVKKSLSLMNLVCPPDCLAGIMFTVDGLDERMAEVMTLVGANLHLETDQIFFQSHVESFYHYMLRQPEELWGYRVLLCDYDNRRLKVHELSCNRRTTPMVVFIDSSEHKEMRREVKGPGTRKQQGEYLDQAFLDIVSERCERNVVSCVYLVGEGYKEEWASDSLRYLCRSRKVFQGNNLYSKGACFGLMERLGFDQPEKKYVFLSQDKLKANISMMVLRRGEESQFVIMNAGTNWFEAGREFDLILESGDTLSLRVAPLTGREPREIHLRLEGMEQRPAWTTRLRILARMQSEQRLAISVKDMGFGEIFPSSGGVWVQEFDIV